MICGTCKHPFSLVEFLRVHWIQTGCQKGRQVWERVMKSKRAGHSGRRILREAYPSQYPSRPMPEDLKERFRAQSISPNAGTEISLAEISVARPGQSSEGGTKQAH